MSRPQATDALIQRLETELEEREAHLNGIFRSAQDDKRDLTDAEKSTATGLQTRMKDVQYQLETVEASVQIAEAGCPASVAQ